MSAPVRTTSAQVTGFLDQKRFAAIGVSREPKDFTRQLIHEFQNRGYDVVPVNPGAAEMDGRQCFARVQDIQPPVAAALVMTPAALSEQVVRECAAAGIKRIWLHRGAGTGAVSDAAVQFCCENGIDVIAGECPFMFLPHSGWVHGTHGFIRKIFGSYPR